MDQHNYIMPDFRGEKLQLVRLLENDLERVTIPAFPVIDAIKTLLLEAGADGALMSGSGPSVFGVFQAKDRCFQAKEFLLAKNVGKVYRRRRISGVSSSGKTRAFGARIRRFESSHPSQ